MKKLLRKKPAKDEREHLLLLGLVDLYILTGRPVGSNTLRECGFEALSSATIRNYFAKLEEQGYLKQQHSSGGRIPTAMAFKLYASHLLHTGEIPEDEAQTLKEKLHKETREVVSYLHQAAEAISEASGCAVFLSAPRFDHDFVLDVKFVTLDASRCISVILTDFGHVYTQILSLGEGETHLSMKKLEAFFQHKLTRLDPPELTNKEKEAANRLYNEVMLRHIAGTSHFTAEDITKTGFSKLLSASDVHDTGALASGLTLFDNTAYLRSLLRECCKLGELRCWIGDDLRKSTLLPCSVIAIPYAIHQTTVGAIGILGPNRIPYKKLFALLHIASEEIGKTLTNSLYKFKISYRQPQESSFERLNDASALLLEEKREENPR